MDGSGGVGVEPTAPVASERPRIGARFVRRRRAGGASAEALYLLQATDSAPRRDSIRRRLLAVADVVSLIASLLVVCAVMGRDLVAVLALLPLLPVWIAFNKAHRLYDRDENLLRKSTLDELPQILQSVTVGCAAAFLLAPLLPDVGVGRAELIAFWCTASIAMPAARYLTRLAIRQRTSRERVLLVGGRDVASLLARKIGAHHELSATVVGYIDSEHALDHPTAGATVPCLGSLEAFEQVCRERGVERVIIGFAAASTDELLDTIRVCKRLRLKVSIVPRLYELIGRAVDLDSVEGLPLLGLRGLSRTRSTLLLKRFVDVVGASLLLALAAPVMLVIAIAVKLDSPGPVLFRQHRVGRGNRTFTLLKFRTMVSDAEERKAAVAHLNDVRDGRMFKIFDDPRVTRAGRLLRRASLDELPQLLNVLRGEMSLVGPRPLIPSEDSLVLGAHRGRLDLTPGLTGPWQVLGRNHIPFDEMVRLDYMYVADWSLWGDLKLLLRTVPVVLGRRGA
jgi:exopolysaccharide biosynthesis polyprenyl glycosylphosphotransferase